MIPFLLIASGAAALVAGVAILRSLGPRVRIGRLLATVPDVPLEDAVRMAERGSPRFVAVHGRIDAEDPFEDAAQRPLVYRRTRIEVKDGRAWRTVEDSVEAVPFELRDGLEAISIDRDALRDGLVVIPRQSVGVVGDLAERAPAGVSRDVPARAQVDQVSSVEHATVLGWPSLDGDGNPVLTGGGGRPLVLSVLERDEAMRVLAGGDRLRPRLAAALLVAGLALGAAGVAWSAAAAVGVLQPAVVEAASVAGPAAAALPGGARQPRLAAADASSPPPSSSQASAAPAASDGTPQPEASSLAGDTRSSGEGPGLVGSPVLAIGGVVLLGVVAAGLTVAYVRLTGGPRRP